MMPPVQAAPQLFSLLLVLCVLGTLVTFAVAALRAMRGARAEALRILARWGLGALAYLLVSVAVSLLAPARVVAVGQDWCFDDWCIAVEGVHHRPAPSGRDLIFTIDLRISNAARLPEAANGFWAYLRDRDGGRHDPMTGAWQEVVATRVPGHGVARTTIDFTVPTGTTVVGFVSGHGGPPCGVLPSLLEIGQGGCLFGRPSMIRLP